MADMIIQARILADLQALLPQGHAWPTEPEAELTQLINQIAGQFARVEQRALDLLIEADPRRTRELLDEWEISLGLPDHCTVGTQAADDRRAAVVAKLTDLGGARIPRYITMARALGYPNARTKRFAPFTCRSACTDGLWPEDARFMWSLDIGENRVARMSVTSRCSEPLRRWGDYMLECVIHRETPAISHVFINYGQ